MDALFDVDTIRAASESNFTLSVNENQARGSFDPILIENRWFSIEEMLNLAPSFTLNIFNHSFGICIEANTDDTDFISPSSPVDFQ